MKTEVNEKKEWKIIFYKKESGKCPIAEYLEKLSPLDKEFLLKWIQYLQEVGNEIRRPYGDYLRDKIYELRVELTNNNTRTLYFFCYEDYIVLTHTFNKKTNKVPDKEIEKALKYKTDFLNRFNINNISEAKNE